MKGKLHKCVGIKHSRCQVRTTMTIIIVQNVDLHLAKQFLQNQ